MNMSTEQEALAREAFYAIAKRNEIEASNKAQALKLSATNESIDFMKGLNRRMADEYAKEVSRVTGLEQMGAKDKIGAGIADASLSQGITGGASKGRIVQTAALQGSEMLGKATQQKESVISKLASQLEKDDQALELQKQKAYNDMLANTIKGPLAALQIQSAGLEGYQEGLNIGLKKEQLSLYNIK